MTQRRPWIALLALFAAGVLASQATAAGNLIGKWQMGNPEADTAPTLTLEFSSGGVVIFNDQIGSYWTSGSNLTIDGWNGQQVTLKYRVEGNTLYLTDPKGEQLIFQRTKY